MTNPKHTDTSRSGDLKPCPVPWCEKKNPPQIWHPGYAPVYTVDCPDCGLETNVFGTEADAIAAWDNRPDDRIEALEALLTSIANAPDAACSREETAWDWRDAARAALGEKQ